MNAGDNPHEKVKAQFCATASALTQLFKSSIELEKQSYNAGRKEAYTEVLGWLVTHGNGELKNIPIGALAAYLQERLDGCATDNPAAEEDEGSAHPQYDFSKLNLSALKVSDRMKRLAPKSLGEESGAILMEDTDGTSRKLYNVKKKKLGPGESS